jgi:uncharacterized protein (TIGR02996 family)
VLGEPVDPTPFEAAMPDEVRAEIARARTGTGPAAAWLVARGRGWGQVGTSTTFLRENKLPPLLVGWLAGIAMFGDDTDRLSDALEGHPATMHVLEAFAAGIVAGVAPAPGHWQRIERLVAFGHPPTLAEVVPIGCASTDRDTRLAATRMARKLGTVARDALESARAGHQGTSRRRLTAANAKLAKNADDERGAILLRLLDGWRATRSLELESAIAVLGTELARARGGALTAKTREALEDDWEALAKHRDARDVDRLLLTSWPKSLDHARRRVDLFTKFSPDPRILRGIASAATRHRSSSSLRFHKAVAKLFSESPVAWLVAAIDDIIKTHDDEEIVAIYDDARSLAQGARTAPTPATLVDEVRRLRGASADLDALWATHIATPGDLAHRAVLADALQSAGDPRGELIALQLHPSPDTTTKKRIADLLAAHADAWTGPIPLVSKSARRFERGFLVKLSSRGAGRELTASYDRPEWVTIEDLFLDGANTVLAQVVRRMPLLRRLATPHAPLLLALARTGTYPQLHALACERPYLAPRDRFPNLRVMACCWIDPRAPFDTTAFERIQTDAAAAQLHAIVHLGLAVDHLRDALELVRSGPTETRFAIAGDFAGFDTDGWRIRAFRKQRVAELAWGGGPSALKDQRPLVVAALARAGVELREVKRIDLGATDVVA